MGNYSIKDLEKLSGIKAHTLRIWEQRYGIISPERTETNIRFYNDEDLRNLLNIALLNNHGIKISKISEMSAADIEREILSITESGSDHSGFIESLTIAMIELDEARFEKVISNGIIKFGFEQTMLQIIHPFLVRIGVMWQVGSIKPAQEHFISNLIRQKIISAIDGQHISYNKSVPKFLLFLPEGELHELSLLFISYFIRARNMSVIYLGQNVPFDDVVSTCKTYNPDFLLTIFTTYPVKSSVTDFIHRLSSSFKKQRIIISGFRVLDYSSKLPTNISINKELKDILSFIQASNIQSARKN